MAVGVLIAAQLTWPELNFGVPWLSYGRLRPLHTAAIPLPLGDTQGKECAELEWPIEILITVVRASFLRW